MIRHSSSARYGKIWPLLLPLSLKVCMDLHQVKDVSHGVHAEIQIAQVPVGKQS